MSSSFEESDDVIESESYDERNEPVYEAEKIIGSRKERGYVEYLVKWKGFQKSDATWEKDGIPQNLIDDYIERLASKKKKSKSKNSDSKSKSKSKSKSRDDDTSNAARPKSIIDSFMKLEDEKFKVFYLVLMSDNTTVQYPSKQVKKEIPKLGIQFLEGFSRR